MPQLLPVKSLLSSLGEMDSACSFAAPSPRLKRVGGERCSDVQGGFQEFKSGMLGTRLSRFLLWYRITPHSSGSSPAEMMWGRTLRSKLDLVRPNSDVRVPETQEGLSSQDTPSPRRQFDVNDTVFAKNYAAGPKW